MNPHPTAQQQLALLDVNAPAPFVRPLPSSLPPVVVVDGHKLQPTPLWDVYWYFAAQRLAMYMARVEGQPAPWTADPTLAAHRFTNTYRAADRVSQYLIGNISYGKYQSPEDVLFRTLLFKIFNKIETWEALRDNVGEPRWGATDLGDCKEVLDQVVAQGDSIYSAAYIMAPPPIPGPSKRARHLDLLDQIMRGPIAERIIAATSLQGLYEVLRSCPGLGEFYAFQYAIDLNYSACWDFDEMDFVVPGPGALDGIHKCFGPAADGLEAQIIRYVTDHQHEHFERLGLTFPGLWGRWLQLIDAQNGFCEVGKYGRKSHPKIKGLTDRPKIKQSYTPTNFPVTAWFPPKWGINHLIPPGARPTWASHDPDSFGR